MRIADYPLVEALMATRDHLIDQRDECRLRIEINGQVQTEEFALAVLPSVKLELRARIEDVDRQLLELGVHG